MYQRSKDNAIGSGKGKGNQLSETSVSSMFLPLIGKAPGVAPT
jgi:hypothetical protein